MDGLIGIASIAILVMESVELYRNSSVNTIVVAAAVCLVYIVYKRGWLTKTDSSHSIKKTDIKADYSLTDDYDDDEDDIELCKVCDSKRTTDDRQALDRIVNAKPSTQTVSEAMQSKSKYDPELDQLTPLYKPFNNHHLMLRVCYNSFEVSLTIWAFANKQFDMDRLSMQPNIMDAYRRAGSPPVDQPYVYVMVDPSESKEPNKPKPYIPMDIRHTMCLGTDLVASVQRVIIELNHYFGSKPCYKYQYM